VLDTEGIRMQTAAIDFYPQQLFQAHVAQVYLWTEVL
jgi:hypothetical protein